MRRHFGMNLREGKRWKWQDWGALLLVVLAAAEMVWLSVRRVMGMNALWYDLGTMTQAIGSVLRGQPLVMTSVMSLENVSRLGGHAEVIYFAFAPLLKVFPSPITLVVIQALLYATGGWAFYRIGRRIGGRGWGLLSASLYLWYPVAQSAVLFDFHGDTLAMPILAWTLEAISAKRWRRYYILIILALLCKFYVIVPVFFIGVVLWLRGLRKYGTGTMLLTGVWGGSLLVLHTWFTFSSSAAPHAAYWKFIISRFQNAGSFSVMGHLVTALVVLSPLIFVGSWRSAWVWLLPAFSIFIPAFLTADAYLYVYHHYALSVPFLVSAVIGMPVNKRAEPPKRWKGIVVLELIFLLNAYFVGFLVAGGLFVHPCRSRSVERYQTILPWVRFHIPKDTTLAATPNWSPFFAFRPVVYQTFNVQRQLNEPVDLRTIGKRAQVFVVDTFFENDLGAIVGIEDDVLAFLLKPSSPFYMEVGRDGVFIFFKNDQVTKRKYIVQSANEGAHSIFVPMGNGLVLRDYAVKGRFDYQHHEWNLTIRYSWWTQSNVLVPSMYALTRLVGYPNSRALHLGTKILRPPSSWLLGETITEQVFLTIPHRSGCYPIEVGWYSPTVQGFAGSSQALVGKTYIIGAWLMGDVVGQGKFVRACP